MGTIPRPLLALVAAILGLCIIAGFALGILPSLRRGAAADDEESPVAAVSDASSNGVRDAQPLSEPPPLPAKAKSADKEAASDAPPSDAAPPAAPKLPNDLPPT